MTDTADLKALAEIKERHEAWKLAHETDDYPGTSLCTRCRLDRAYLIARVETAERERGQAELNYQRALNMAADKKSENDRLRDALDDIAGAPDCGPFTIKDAAAVAKSALAATPSQEQT